MILLSGGTDGGTISHVVELAEDIGAARPRARLGSAFNLPVIYAGNKDARTQVADVLQDVTALTVTDNIRPSLERENLDPARLKIQDLFLEHVMAHAPGYDKLIEWTGAPIMPTPAAVGRIMEIVARQENITVIGVDIGGATTDVFSVFGGALNRTVSANLGMSYSVSNVLAEAGLDDVLRWLPVPYDAGQLRDGVKNKMIRPTTIPHTLIELVVEQALAREAISLAFQQHRSLVTGLKGTQRQRDISEAFDQAGAASLIDMQALDLLVGSGGVLSHAPRRAQAMMMLMDAFQPEGVTELAVDSIFMMPHLGVLSQVHEQAALDVFNRDCLVRLGTCIAASQGGKPGRPCMSYRIVLPDSAPLEGELAFGELLRVPAAEDQWAEVIITPARGVDVGAGKSVRLERECRGGAVGIVLDARGRPIRFAPDAPARQEQSAKWLGALEVYPPEAFVAEEGKDE